MAVLTLLLLGLEAEVAETRDTGSQRGVMVAQWILRSCKVDSLGHLFHLFQAVPGAREDPGVPREPKGKTKSENKYFLTLLYKFKLLKVLLNKMYFDYYINLV